MLHGHFLIIGEFMKQQLTELWITDKTGQKMFKTTCSTQYKSSEERNLVRHIEQACKYPDQYKFLDIDSVRIEQRNYELGE
jgi:hypothetical protein